MEGENISDWLYIVFMIVAGLFSLLGGKKKKKHPHEVLGQPGKEIIVEEETQPQKGFWEVLQDMQESPNKVPQPISQPVTSPPGKQKLKQSKKKEPTPFLTAESSFNKPELENNILNTPIEETNNFTDIEFNNAVELRKAVIYTEILNRKY